MRNPARDFADRLGSICCLALALLLFSTPARAGWTPGQFQSAGKPVDECHCAPAGTGPFPAVIILHGSGPRNMPTDDFEDMCTKLAEDGYYAEYLYATIPVASVRISPTLSSRSWVPGGDRSIRHLRVCSSVMSPRSSAASRSS
jgi:hypothetical protein